MRLVKYKVNKFRSVKGTEWIETDQWTCFVGSNESGKTNLLLPLWKFNPADASSKIDVLLDYPRDEYSQYKAEEGKREHEPFIEVLFEIDKQELISLNTLKEESNYPANTEEEANDDVENNESETTQQEEYNFELTKFILIKKSYAGNFYIYVSDESCEEKTKDLDKFQIYKKLVKAILSRMPKFVYYSEYGNLDSDLYLPRVIEDLEQIDGREESDMKITGKELMKARTLKILFGHLGLDPAEILELGEDDEEQSETDEKIQEGARNKQERFVQVQSAATNLSSQFKDWWSQGNYIFNFNADGKYFRILVSDSERPSPIELELRSKGLQWFFSFFLVFLAESDNEHSNCILLLDEPGLTLHPEAQKDLIQFFNELSKKNQLIYTTHLPFLVDHSNLDRVKAVYTENGLTKISNDISIAKGKKAIQPVNAAIGITVAESLLIGCDIVIVEGITDQLYLTMIKNYLIAKKKFIPKNELAFIPVGGAKAVKTAVSIIYGSNRDLPIVLLDSDEPGKIFQQKLKDSLYKGDKNKVIETDTFTKKEGSEIEDLIPAKLIVNNFDRICRTDDRVDLDDIDISSPIMPQLEKIAEDASVKLDEDWKFQISKAIKKKFKNTVDEEVVEKWLELFKNFR